MERTKHVHHSLSSSLECWAGGPRNSILQELGMLKPHRCTPGQNGHKDKGRCTLSPHAGWNITRQWNNLKVPNYPLYNRISCEYAVNVSDGNTSLKDTDKYICVLGLYIPDIIPFTSKGLQPVTSHTVGLPSQWLATVITYLALSGTRKSKLMGDQSGEYYYFLLFYHSPSVFKKNDKAGQTRYFRTSKWWLQYILNFHSGAEDCLSTSMISA